VQKIDNHCEYRVASIWMSATAAYATLRAIGSPYLTTREAAAALRVSASSASRTLRTLSPTGSPSVSDTVFGGSPSKAPMHGWLLRR